MRGALNLGADRRGGFATCENIITKGILNKGTSTGEGKSPETPGHGAEDINWGVDTKTPQDVDAPSWGNEGRSEASK